MNRSALCAIFAFTYVALSSGAIRAQTVPVSWDAAFGGSVVKSDAPTVAVSKFSMLGPGATDAKVLALTDLVSLALSGNASLDVVDRLRTPRLLSVGVIKPDPNNPPLKGVSMLVSGSVMALGQSGRINVRLMNVQNGQVVDENIPWMPGANLVAIARTVAAAVEGHLAHSKATRSVAPNNIPASAITLYTEAVALDLAGNWDEALERYRDAARDGGAEFVEAQRAVERTTRIMQWARR